eukprot:scaffold98170_cov70-Attheya_sp.AAC.2
MSRRIGHQTCGPSAWPTIHHPRSAHYSAHTDTAGSNLRSVGLGQSATFAESNLAEPDLWAYSDLSEQMPVLDPGEHTRHPAYSSVLTDILRRPPVPHRRNPTSDRVQESLLLL